MATEETNTAKIMAIHFQMVWDGLPREESDKGLAEATRDIDRLSTRQARLEAFQEEVGPDQPMTQEALSRWWENRKSKILDDVVVNLTAFIKPYDTLGTLTQEHTKAFLAENMGLL